MKTGTKEWAEKNKNIQLGCENGCRYCYARYYAIVRSKRCTAEQWLNPVIDRKKVDKGYRHTDGVVMIPSTHDITSRNIIEILTVIRKLLDADNNILIVTKPLNLCIELICRSLKQKFPDKYKTNVTFRFTIGSAFDQVLKFWEPWATGIVERFNCLRYAYDEGFNTSVSCEPFLDPLPAYVYEMTKDYITDSFWVGLLRDFDNRVVLDGVTQKQKERFVEPLRKLVKSEQCIKAIYKVLNGKPYVKWKDSIRKIIEKES